MKCRRWLEYSAIRSGNMMEAASAILWWLERTERGAAVLRLDLVGMPLEPACLKCIK